MADQPQTVGFIGYGAMATLMAAHIREAGYRSVACTPSARGGQAADGSAMLSPPRALAEASDIVLVSVPTTRHWRLPPMARTVSCTG